MAVMAEWSGREACALRTALRMTIETFAERLGVGVRTVAHWEAQGSGIVPRAGMQEVLDAALEQATPAQQERFRLLLHGPKTGAGSGGHPDKRGLTARPGWSTEQEQRILEAAARRTEGDEDVNRRQMLTQLGLLGLAASLGGAETVRRGLATAAAGDGHAADADEWERIADEYGRAVYVTPRDRLLRDLTADLSILQQSLERSDDATTRRLCRVAGQLATVSALSWAGLGEIRQARWWWRTARQLADRSGDDEIRTLVRGWEVVDGLEEQRPVAVILDQAREGISIAGHHAWRGTAGLHAGLAQTLAVAGRPDDALAALEQAADVADRLPAKVVADGESLFGRSEVHQRHTESYVYTQLGDTTRAYAAQERALELYPDSLARPRGKMLLHRAGCMIQDGDVGGGLSYATHVLDSLPAEYRADEGVRAIGRLTMRFVPERERGRPEAVELRELLASA